MQSPQTLPEPAKKIQWGIVVFLFALPILALILGPVYLWHFEFSPWILVFAIAYAALGNMAITAGYHRLWAHRAYEANLAYKLFWLFVASSTFQNSALKWCSDHRRHHRFEDTEKDPYSINKGFWYAHMQWMFYKDEAHEKISVPDLEKDFWLQLQHKHYLLISIFAGFFVPTFVGFLLGDAAAGFVFGGIARIAFSHQTTFFVNSLAHTLGRRPYSLKITARDSLFVAVLTHGEGYHNYHHTFQTDYRNGLRWFEWDPTKWMIRASYSMGLVTRLLRVPEREILKAKLEVQAASLPPKTFTFEKLQELKVKIVEIQGQVQKLREEYGKLKSEVQTASFAHRQKIRSDLALKKAELKYSLRLWKTHLRYPQLHNDLGEQYYS